MRSLDLYFPEHGNVYIVTDNQKPSFLNNKAIIVDHLDIMDKLPTYSSKKIESNIFKIKNLSEKFIYFNDDVFLGTQFNINDYFHENINYIFYEKDIKNHDNKILSHVNATSLSKKLLEEIYPTYQHNKKPFSHSPRANIKSHYIEFIKEFEHIYLICQNEIFRDKHIPSLLADMFIRWTEIKKYALQKDINYLYGETKNRNSLNDIINNFNQLNYFCINDSSDNLYSNDSSLLYLQYLLNHLFPIKSSYEY